MQSVARQEKKSTVDAGGGVREQRYSCRSVDARRGRRRTDGMNRAVYLYMDTIYIKQKEEEKKKVPQSFLSTTNAVLKSL